MLNRIKGLPHLAYITSTTLKQQSASPAAANIRPYVPKLPIGLLERWQRRLHLESTDPLFAPDTYSVLDRDLTLGQSQWEGPD